MKYLFVIVSAKTLFMLWIILYGEIALGPDEAQYWSWSQALDFGYYSKPPGIAWSIALGNALLGPSELGVRLYALVFGSLLPLALYYLARCAKQSEKIALGAGYLMALTPMGFLSTLFATTDVGFVFFWVLGVAQILKQEKNNGVLFALLVAFGALFKWPIYLLWLFGWRYWRYFWISLIGLLPSLYWNMSHEWATFRHVGATIGGGSESLSRGNPLEFIGAQAALLSPLLFFLFMYSLFIAYKKRKEINTELSLCLCITMIPLTIYLIAAFFQKIQGNWCVFVYPTLFVWMAAVFERRQTWLCIALICSLFLSVFMLFLPTLIVKEWLPVQMNRMNPFKECVGWRELRSVIAITKEKEDGFLFSHSYQVASELSFYNNEHQRAYFFNLEGRRQNQFSYWQGMEQLEKGKNGLFVVVENKYFEPKEALYQLKNYFKKIELVQEYPLFSAHGESLKIAKIYRCFDYNGEAVSSSKKIY